MRTKDDDNINQAYNTEVIEEGAFSRAISGGKQAIKSGMGSIIPRAKGLVTGDATTGIRDATKQGYHQGVQKDLNKDIEKFKSNISSYITELERDMKMLGYDPEKYPEIANSLKQLLTELQM